MDVVDTVLFASSSSLSLLTLCALFRDLPLQQCTHHSRKSIWVCSCVSISDRVGCWGCRMYRPLTPSSTSLVSSSSSQWRPSRSRSSPWVSMPSTVSSSNPLMSLTPCHYCLTFPCSRGRTGLSADATETWPAENRIVVINVAQRNQHFQQIDTVVLPQPTTYHWTICSRHNAHTCRKRPCYHCSRSWTPIPSALFTASTWKVISLKCWPSGVHMVSVFFVVYRRVENSAAEPYWILLWFANLSLGMAISAALNLSQVAMFFKHVDAFERAVASNDAIDVQWFWSTGHLSCVVVVSAVVLMHTFSNLTAVLVVPSLRTSVFLPLCGLLATSTLRFWVTMLFSTFVLGKSFSKLSMSICQGMPHSQIQGFTFSLLFRLLCSMCFTIPLLSCSTGSTAFGVVELALALDIEFVFFVVVFDVSFLWSTTFAFAFVVTIWAILGKLAVHLPLPFFPPFETHKVASIHHRCCSRYCWTRCRRTQKSRPLSESFVLCQKYASWRT